MKILLSIIFRVSKSYPFFLQLGGYQLYLPLQSPPSSQVSDVRSGIKSTYLSVLTPCPARLPRRVKSSTDKIKLWHLTMAKGTRQVEQVLKKHEVWDAMPFLKPPVNRWDWNLSIDFIQSQSSCELISVPCHVPSYMTKSFHKPHILCPMGRPFSII